LTGRMRRSQEFALRRPILSGPPDLADLVRNSKTSVKGWFQRGRHLPRFEPHLPKIHTLGANTSNQAPFTCSHSFRSTQFGITWTLPETPQLRLLSDCVGRQAFWASHGCLFRMMALRMVRSFRATATRATIFGLPAASRRSRKALRAGL